MVLAAAASVAICIFAFFALSAPDAGQLYATGPGDMLRIALSDGSTVMLDADSRLQVAFSRARRDVAVEQGRAHFEVAKNPERPFIVAAGDRRVRSIGTVFDVSRSPARTSVLLIEGRVAVSSTVDEAAAARYMSPGDRVVYDAAGGMVADRPDVPKLVAWQSGQAIFSDDSLAAAAEELNRYSRRPLVIADNAAAGLRVSGVFRAGATEEFATAVSELLPIDVEVGESRITIRSRSPDA